MRLFGRSSGESGSPDSDLPNASVEPVDAEEVSTIDADQEPNLAAERQALIDLIVYAWDRARSPGVVQRLAAGLEQVGVQVIDPKGERYDPDRHEVGGVQPTTDIQLMDTVAETESAGFVDRGRVIREPVVVVYRPE